MDSSGGSAGSLTVALPPRESSSPTVRRSASAATPSNPPPRPPPPPRLSPVPARLTPSPHTVQDEGFAIRAAHRPLPVPPPESPSKGPTPELPPPLIPVPESKPVQCTESAETQQKQFHQASFPVDKSPTKQPPAVPPRNFDKVKVAEKRQDMVTPATPIPTSGDQSQEAMDNANNECCICLERAPDCVIYTCGHMCMCYSCAVGIKQKQDAACPMCRKEIKDIIKIFRS